MPAANAFALWEAVKGVSHLFSGGKTETPLTQQTASVIIPSFDDEAIQAALDTTLHGIDPSHLKNVLKVRNSLEPHQRNRWRKVITTLKLTEKFESFTTSKKTAETQGNENPESTDPKVQSQRRRASSGKVARKDTTETFDRRTRDYEYTAEDPRVQHFVFISTLVESEQQEASGIGKAKAYLLSAGLILEKSLENQVTEKVSQATAAASDTIYNNTAQLIIGTDEYDRIVGSTQEGDERNQALDAAIKVANASRKKTIASNKAKIFTGGHIFAIGVAIAIIIALIGAAASA